MYIYMNMYMYMYIRLFNLIDTQREKERKGDINNKKY